MVGSDIVYNLGCRDAVEVGVWIVVQIPNSRAGGAFELQLTDADESDVYADSSMILKNARLREIGIYLLHEYNYTC